MEVEREGEGGAEGDGGGVMVLRERSGRYECSAWSKKSRRMLSV